MSNLVLVSICFILNILFKFYLIYNIFLLADTTPSNVYLKNPIIIKLLYKYLDIMDKMSFESAVFSTAKNVLQGKKNNKYNMVIFILILD